MKEITKKDFIECIKKHDFFNSEDCCECIDEIRDDLQKKFKNKIVCDYAFETSRKDLIDYVMWDCQDRIVKGWFSYYENGFVFWLIEYEE